jgi:hypothetical protein
MKSYVDILKLADLYKPKAVNPRIADPITAPARLIDMNMRNTMIANVTLDRRSFVLTGRGCVVDSDLGETDPKADIWTSFVMSLDPERVRGEGGNA